jgi:ribonuclease P protein component
MNENKVYRFARPQRLLSPKAFDTVYRNGARASTIHFNVRWLASDVVAEDCKGRLGVTVAKRLLRRAVDRNAVKRVVREAYRKHLVSNSVNDLVVGLSSVKGLAKPRTQQGKAELHIEIASLLKQLHKKIQTQPPKRVVEPLLSGTTKPT